MINFHAAEILHTHTDSCDKASTQHRRKAIARKFKRNLSWNEKKITTQIHNVSRRLSKHCGSLSTHITLFKLTQPQTLNYARVFLSHGARALRLSALGRICVLRHLIKLCSSEWMSCGFFVCYSVARFGYAVVVCRVFWKFVSRLCEQKSFCLRRILGEKI